MSVDFYKEFGDLGYLANYSNHGFYKDGVYYKTVEHYYQSKKFNDKELVKKIIECDTPKEASNIGRDRENIRIDNFKDKKLDVMYEGVLEKFRQNSDIRAKLIETRNQEIREMTTKENYWGIGPNLDGENHIGKILMKVRDKVKEETINNIIDSCRGKKVYVIGHHNPDPDSVFSAYILTNILKSMGIDCEFSVRDKSFVDGDLIKDYLDEKPTIVNNYEDKYFILVDHNNLDGISKDNVIGSIDHHKITGDIDNLVEIEYASCGLLIYDLFKDKYKFSKKEKILIVLSVLSDTDYLISSRFGLEDKKLYNELKIKLDENELKLKYFKTTDFTKSIDDNLHSNYKEYMNGRIKRSMIYSYTDDYNKYYDLYVSKLIDNDINLLIWCDYENKRVYIHYDGLDIELPGFTTSTNLIMEYLEINFDNNKEKRK